LVLLDGDPDHPPHDEALLARYPHASALGKLLLADRPDWRATARGLRQLTASTIIDPDHLDAELAQCREERLARQCGELHPDRGCLAVPIHDVTDGTLVAGLALSGPPDRVAGPNTELVAELREHAHQLAPLLA
ncbi:IclR family transcriptional regulator C-terminal domain-containing protein, partial [Amycolatopsis sp. SID8362]|uniref:IclR family transcriptional regulator domain-containing protein n=1 Tax=Amycolatopsis sp. SID8362 TaxID=2690346 RepID=UPI00142A0E62